jgi:hypothetical protein
MHNLTFGPLAAAGVHRYLGETARFSGVRKVLHTLEMLGLRNMLGACGVPGACKVLNVCIVHRASCIARVFPQ